MSEHSQPPKRLTFISRRAPYGRDNAASCLDLVLACSVFDQEVNYLFAGDGVFQLLKNQQPAGISSKNLSAGLAALEIYGVENVFVDREALDTRQLAIDDLAIDVKPLEVSQIQTLLQNSDVVFNL